MIEYERKFARATASDISRLERARGIAIPEDLKAYLMEVGGGVVRANGFLRLSAGYEQIVTAIHGFSEEFDSLFNIEVNRFNNFSQDFDRRIIFIASLLGQAGVFMDLRRIGHGQVFLFDPDQPPLRTPELYDEGFSGSDAQEALLCRRIADTFSGFLAMLEPETP